mmetsp:Transcript_60128/g.111500  ORF Transcript_60128/g.111500 Transcript_60128/m.111500 type:complete len:172 (-) Transcript_60128:64-579(-)
MLALILVACSWQAMALVRKSDPVSGFDLSCYEASDKGLGYKGLITSTSSGRTCQNWLEKTPHDISQTPTSENGLGNHNYCRNPDGSEEKPWCYTMDPATPKETCAVPLCAADDRDYTAEADQLAMKVATGLDCDCAAQLYGSTDTTKNTAVPLVLRQVHNGRTADGKCLCH